MPEEETMYSYQMQVFVNQYNLGVCATIMGSLYTLCVITVKWLILVLATRSQSIWRQLEELQVKDEGEIQHLVTNKYSLLVSNVCSMQCTL